MSKGIVVYAPGLLSTGYLHSISLKARMFFLRRGYEFRVVHAKIAGSIEERAEPIKVLLDDLFNKDIKNIHLVCHSMAGLSARLVVDEINVDTLTTMSTPHRGSSFADKHVKDPVLRPDDNDFEQAYKQLTSSHMAEWNKTCPDNHYVKYFSMGFTNDIMVTPESARWGTYLGTGDCSHLKQVSPYFGGQFVRTMTKVLDNLDSIH